MLIQVRVVGALVLRETRATFGTSRLGYLWAIITPASSIAVLVLVFSLAGRHAPFGPSFGAFFGTGIITLQLYGKLSGSLMNVFEANKALLTYPPIKALDTIIARVILIAMTYFFIALVGFALLYFFGQAEMPARPEFMVEAFVMTVLFGTGVGMINAILKSAWTSWSNIESIITRPLFFISAVFYVPSYLPPAAISILKWNPVLHLVEWMRDGYYRGYDSAIFDPKYVIFIILVLFPVGLGGERLFRKFRN